jgi:hypothetical protein
MGLNFSNLTFGQNPFRQILFARHERYFTFIQDLWFISRRIQAFMRPTAKQLFELRSATEKQDQNLSSHLEKNLNLAE